MADDVITNPLKEQCSLFPDDLFEESPQRASDILNSKIPVGYFDSVLPGPTIVALLGAIGATNKKFVTIQDLYNLEFQNVKDCRGKVFKSAQKRIRDMFANIASMTPDALEEWVSPKPDVEGMLHTADEYLKFRKSSAYKELENKLSPIHNLAERRFIGFLIWCEYKTNSCEN